jgi:hypothetical protein
MITSVATLKTKNSKALLLYIYIYVYNFSNFKIYLFILAHYANQERTTKKRKVSAKAGSYWRRRINTERYRGGWRAAKMKGQ